MRVSDIIRNVLDIIDQAESPDPEPTVAIAVDIEPVTGLHDMQRLAGLLDEPEYANEPNEVIAPMAAAFPSGDDVHHSKNPADIRTNAPSMFPGFQAGMK